MSPPSIPVHILSSSELQNFPILSPPLLRSLHDRYGPIYRLSTPPSFSPPSSRIIVASVTLIREVLLNDSRFQSDVNDQQFGVLFGPQPLSTLHGPVLKLTTSFTADTVIPTTPIHFSNVLNSARTLWSSLPTSGPISLLDPVFEHTSRVSVATFSLHSLDDVSKGLVTAASPQRIGELLRIVDPVLSLPPYPEGAVEHAKEGGKALVEALLPLVLRSAENGVAQVMSKMLTFQLPSALKNAQLDQITLNVAFALLPRWTWKVKGDEKAMNLEQILEQMPERLRAIPGQTAGMVVTATFTAKLVLGAVWRLLHSGDMLKEIQEEMEKVTIDRESMNDPKKTPKLEAFIREVVMMHAPVTVHPRIALKDTKIGEFQVKKGDRIGCDVDAAHGGERVFGKGKKETKIVTFNFRESAHWCVGSPLAWMQVKTTIAVLVKEYKFRGVDEEVNMGYVGLEDVFKVAFKEMEKKE